MLRRYVTSNGKEQWQTRHSGQAGAMPLWVETDCTFGTACRAGRIGCGRSGDIIEAQIRPNSLSEIAFKEGETLELTPRKAKVFVRTMKDSAGPFFTVCDTS
jgi:hypothetical protein